MTAPRLSVALARTPDPDVADVQVVSLRGAPLLDATAWVERVFTVRSAPWWVVALFALRQLLVPLLLLNPARDARSDPFAVREVVDGEALVVTDAPHLLFRLGVAVEPTAQLLVATTAVHLHGLRGRLYMAPVSVLHGPVLRAMMRRAVARSRRDARRSMPPSTVV